MWCVSTGRKPVNKDLIDEVNTIMTEDPRLSIQAVATRVNTTVSTAFKITRVKLKLKAYRIQVVQKLEPNDLPNRQMFATTLLDREWNDHGYIKKTAGYGEQRIPMSCLKSHQCQLNCMFGALYVSGVVGPYFFTDRTVNGANYLDMLQMYAISAIAAIPDLVFQQDRAPPH